MSNSASILVSPAKTPPSALPPIPESPQIPPKGRRWLLISLLGLVVIAAVVWYSRSKPEPARPEAVAAVRTARVAVGTIQQTVRLAGQTAAQEFSTITAPMQQGPDAGAMILEYLVTSGARVKKGDVVAQFDTQTLKDHITDVEDQVRDAANAIVKRRAEHEVEMESLAQSIRVAKANVDKAQIELRAAEVRTTIDRELMQLSLEDAQATYKQYQADVQQKRLAHGADIRLLEIAKVRADRHLLRHTTDFKRYTVRSPRDGLAVVQQIYRNNEAFLVQAGDQLRPGQVFLQIVRPDRMQVKATMNQAESEMFRVGQQCRVKLDAVPSLTLPGQIDTIGAVAVSASRRDSYFIRSVPLTASIAGTHDLLLPDMSAALEVILAEQSGARQVPLAAVKSENGKTFVWRKRTDGGFERRDIQLGLSNATHIAVLAGLEANDVVALDTPETK